MPSTGIRVKRGAKGKCSKKIRRPNRRCSPLGRTARKGGLSTVFCLNSASKGPKPTFPPAAQTGNWHLQRDRNCQHAENTSSAQTQNTGHLYSNFNTRDLKMHNTISLKRKNHLVSPATSSWLTLPISFPGPPYAPPAHTQQPAPGASTPSPGGGLECLPFPHVLQAPLE